jgi:hypothetical protein
MSLDLAGAFARFNVLGHSYAAASSGSLSMAISVASTSFGWSGDIELGSKPTWAY